MQNKYFEIDENTRKFHYWRGFAVGAGLSLMVAGVLFVLYCRAILAII